MQLRYTPTVVEEELKKLIDSKREYLARQEAGSRGAQYMQHEILVLERTLRELELRSDYFQTAIAEDICEKILQVRKDPLADKYVGILVYYEMKPRYEWDGAGRNMVACVGNVADWPAGDYNMVDLGNGAFVVDSDRPAPSAWVLGGQFIPIPAARQN